MDTSEDGSQSQEQGQRQQEEGQQEEGQVMAGAAGADEMETLREAVRLRDELLDEMQRALAQKREETDSLVQETRRIGEEQVKLLRLQLDEKHKQVKLLQDMVNDMDSNNRLNSDVQEISGSEAQRERPFVDDFLLKVLGERDELTDQLHDLHNELAETKARLGTTELEKERLNVEMRTLAARVHAPASPAGSVPASPSRPAKPKRSRGSTSGRSKGNGASADSDEVIRKLNEKIFQLQEELAEHQRQGSRLKRKETQRLREAERLKHEMDSLAKERATLLNDLRKTKDESTHLALVQTLEEQLEQHESQRRQLENKMASLRRENDESASLIKHLQAKVVEYEQADAVAAAKELQEKVSTLSDTVLSRDNRIHELQQTCDELRESNAQLQSQVQTLEGRAARVEELEEKLKTMEAELELAQQGFASSTEENKALSDKNNALEEQCAELKELKETHEQQLEQKGKDVAALMAEIEQLNEEADTHLAQKAELEKLKAKSQERTKSLEERERFCEKILSRFKDEQKRRRALHNQLMEVHGNIRVHCRIRPVLTEEQRGKKTSAVVVEPTDAQTVQAELKPGDPREFEFDRVHGPDADNEAVFLELQTLLTSFIDGYNVCIMAYGQTGSGKTHTMLGPSAVGSTIRGTDGVVFRAVDEVFKLIAERETELQHTVTISVAEIYNNKIRDLLGEDFEAAHDVIVGSAGDADVPTLTKTGAENVEQVLEAVNRGMRFRAERTTNLNERSSRSHLVITLSCAVQSRVDGKRRISRLHMVDLAGSENNKMAKQSGDGLREASNINKSLSALGDVMAALDMRRSQPKRHIPYRNSKLTLMLKDAIGGNAKTLLLACASPTAPFAGETVNTLRFGLRARNVQKGRIMPAKA